MRENSLHFWSVLWLVFFFLGMKTNLTEILGNKGLHVISNQYYRFFTGLLIHVNIFHMAINITALYWVNKFLQTQAIGLRPLCFSVVTAIIANILFSAIYPESTSVGGSPVVFSLIGLIVIFQLFHPELPRFQVGTAYASWIIGYGILGNIPVFSKNISTFVIHALAILISLAFGYLCIKIHVF